MANRIYSIDSLRAIAIFFVLIAHINPFRGYGDYGNHLFFLLDTIGQFDVQFFFIVSGYFLAKKLQQEDLRTYLPATIQKLASMYLFGILIYIPVLALRTIGAAFLNGEKPLDSLTTRFLTGLDPIGLLYYGDSFAVPLWFLTALIFAICFIALFVWLDKSQYILPVAATIHLIGIIGESYPMLLDVPFPTRDALFFGFFYVALGYHLWSIDWTPDRNRSRVYLGAIGVFVFLQLVEQYAVGYHIQAGVLGQEIHTTNYTVATVFLAATVFIYALSNPELGKTTPLPDLGKYAVGVYLVHLPVFQTITAVNEIIVEVIGIDLSTTLIWQLGMTPLVYVLSLGFYLLAARIGLIELGGSHIPRISRVRKCLHRSQPSTTLMSD